MRETFHATHCCDNNNNTYNGIGAGTSAAGADSNNKYYNSRRGAATPTPIIKCECNWRTCWRRKRSWEMDQKISCEAESISFHRHRCRCEACACVCVCVHYCLINSSLRMQDVDGVWCCGRFYRLYFYLFWCCRCCCCFSYFPLSLSMDLLFSRHLLGWRWRHENNNNNIFSGNDALLTAYVCRNDDSCGVVRRPKSNRTLDARDVRFPFCRRRQFNFSIHRA